MFAPMSPRILRVLAYTLMTAAVAACLGVGLRIILRSAPQDRLLVVAVLVRYVLPILVVVWAILYYRGLSWLALSLGTDGKCLMVRDRTERVVASAAMGAVYTDGAYLLIGRRLVPLHHLRRMLSIPGAYAPKSSAACRRPRSSGVTPWAGALCTPAIMVSYSPSCSSAWCASKRRPSKEKGGYAITSASIVAKAAADDIRR
jgi:hypothetical protein